MSQDCSDESHVLCEEASIDSSIDDENPAPHKGRRPKKNTIAKAAKTAVTKNKNQLKEKQPPRAKESKGKKKAEIIKPQYVHGTPVNPFQNEPAVSNPYNYDPLAEAMQLGKGQLQSAYRNSKSNIAPPKDKKMYKLEPKHSDEAPFEENANVPLYGGNLGERDTDNGVKSV